MNKLRIEEEFIDDSTILKLFGLIDSATSFYLESKLDELIVAERVRLVIDLTEVDYISSAGWGIFVSEIKGLREKGGDIKLAGMTPEVRDVFELLEFDTLLTPYESATDALMAFDSRKSNKTT
ncbi:MAG TPA: STAS domain-containing protein [Candidatus Krumholzibacteriaceae bacterium]|nr:STAS domain-containing protein [Candidatus Krumholzibacteriaceae bacterium]